MSHIFLSCNGKRCRLQAELAGERRKCPYCGRSVLVPPAEIIEAHNGREFTHEGLAGIELKAPEPPPPGAQWVPGQRVFGDFVVDRQLGRGGMGIVYLVRNVSNGRHFAVKRMLKTDERARRNFLIELQTLCDLPEYPHLVPFRFFRVEGDEIVLFSDFVEGGTLADWIKQHKLTGLAGVIDVAIQTAWGLRAVHEWGGVHCDFKPLNVLMSPAGVAQVNDFGLAGVRAVQGETPDPAERGVLIVMVKGVSGTKPYRSPEQSRGEPLSRQSDVFSWGVSIVHLLLRKSLTREDWEEGEKAPAKFEQLVANERLPAAFVEVVWKALRPEPDERWLTLADAAEELRRVFREVSGRDYPRQMPEVPRRVRRQSGVQERRSNDGSCWTDPREWLREAVLLQGGDPAGIDTSRHEQGASRQAQMAADIGIFDEARSIFEQLVSEGRKDLEPRLAALWSEIAIVYGIAGDFRGQVDRYDRSISIYKRLVEQEGQRELANELARAYVNKGNALSTSGDKRGAADLYDRAIAIRRRLVEQEGQQELASELARAYVNRAALFSALEDNHRAANLYDRAITLYERLERKGQRELADDLAGAYLNRAALFSAMGNKPAAVALYDRVISIRRRLVEQEDRRELTAGLADAYMNNAIAVRALGDNKKAVELYDQSLALYERLVGPEGRFDLAGDLAWVRAYAAAALLALGDRKRAAAEAAQAVPVLQSEVERTGRADLRRVLDWAKLALAEILSP